MLCPVPKSCRGGHTLRPPPAKGKSQNSSGKASSSAADNDSYGFWFFVARFRAYTAERGISRRLDSRAVIFNQGVWPGELGVEREINRLASPLRRGSTWGLDQV